MVGVVIARIELISRLLVLRHLAGLDECIRSGLGYKQVRRFRLGLTDKSLEVGVSPERIRLGRRSPAPRLEFDDELSLRCSHYIRPLNAMPRSRNVEPFQHRLELCVLLLELASEFTSQLFDFLIKACHFLEEGIAGG